MINASEIRMGLVRRRVSQEVFAERCGVGLGALKEMFRVGEVSGEVMNEYAALDNAEEALKEGESSKESVDKNGGCIFGRPVRNERLQLVVFPDGSEMRMRKKMEFRPKYGLPCEGEPSEEEGFVRLVGLYRNNGVRLD